MIISEGPKSMFRGNGINVMIQAPFSAFEFYFYEVYKNNLFAGNANTFEKKLLCGGLTGMTAAVIVYPMDVVKTHITINDKKPTSMCKVTKYIIRKNGI